METCQCKKSMCLCPVSLGIAIGATCALGVLFWTAWAMCGGAVPEMATRMMPAATWSEAGVRALWALGKGFVCGFVIGFIYDFVACYMKRFCSKAGNGCSCSCNK